MCTAHICLFPLPVVDIPRRWSVFVPVLRKYHSAGESHRTPRGYAESQEDEDSNDEEFNQRFDNAASLVPKGRSSNNNGTCDQGFKSHASSGSDDTIVMLNERLDRLVRDQNLCKKQDHEALLCQQQVDCQQQQVVDQEACRKEQSAPVACRREEALFRHQAVAGSRG